MMKYANNKFFENFSSIYVREFFMYISLKNDKNINIMPFVEIDNIFYKLVTHDNNLYNMITNIKYEQYKYNNSDKKLEDGQHNLKLLMKKIFNHDTVCDFIKKIDLIIYYDDKYINLKCYNNDKISLIKAELHNILNIEHNIYLNTKRMILNYDYTILDDCQSLNDYNINDNVLLKLSVNMTYYPLDY